MNLNNPTPNTDHPSDPALQQLNDVLLKIVSVRTISDEMFAGKMREQLTAWADAIPHHGIKNFGYVISFDTITEINSFHVTLMSLIEHRTPIEEKRASYNNETLPPTPVLKQRIDNVWNIPGGGMPQELEQPVEVIIPESFRKQKCLECMGRVNYVCDRCQGHKEINCPDCNGSKQKKCSQCRGSGKIKCWSCSGKGMITDSTKRALPCETCHGEGVSSCTHCRNGFVECTTCKSTGSVPCTQCSGEGMHICPICKGKGEVLLYLAFQRNFTPLTESKYYHNAALPKLFPVKRLKELMTTRNAINIVTQAFPQREFLSEKIDASMRTLITDLVALSYAHIQKDPAVRIIQQKLHIQPCPVWKVTYHFDNKSFDIFFVGDSMELYSETDPISDMLITWMHTAQQSVARYKWTEAYTNIHRVLAVKKDHPEALMLLKKMNTRYTFTMRLMGLLGGILVGSIMVGYIVYVKRKSINVFWPMLQSWLASCLLGYGIGLIAGLIGIIQKPLRVIKKRIPFLISAAVVGVLYAFVIFIVHYDPILKKDTEQYIREFQQGLPYGIPSVPWDDDIKFLKQIIKKFKSTGVNVSNAERGLQKLEALKVKKVKEDAKQINIDKKQREKIRNSHKIQHKQRRYQDDFNKEFERYENLAIQKKLNTKQQKINYLSNLIGRYRGKKVDMSKAYVELNRLQKRK